jgi:hypothetical protein
MPRLNYARLARIAPFASTDESRPTLQGVHIRPDGAIEATDGHVLAIYANAHDGIPEGIYTVSKEAVKLCKAATKRIGGEDDRDDLRVVTMDPDGGIILSHDGASVTLRAVGGVFPNTAQVMPRDTGDLGAIALNPKLLDRFGKDVHLHFTFTGPTRAVVVRIKGTERYADDYRPDFVGLVMPLRTPDVMPAIPAVAYGRTDDANEDAQQAA